MAVGGSPTVSWLSKNQAVVGHGFVSLNKVAQFQFKTPSLWNWLNAATLFNGPSKTNCLPFDAAEPTHRDQIQNALSPYQTGPWHLQIIQIRKS